MKEIYGPVLPISEEIHRTKYRLDGESFYSAMTRVADGLKDSPDHFYETREILLDMRFLPGGRIQSAIGSPREVTAFNCFVSGRIEDSMSSIMKRATESAETMRRGGGIGYDFSSLRPQGDLIESLDSRSSGPVSFMGIYDSICKTISSAGHRRGAQMGVLRVDHPDIERFIRAKRDSTSLTKFNISVGVTSNFMECLRSGQKFPLVFEGEVYRTVDPRPLWDEIMRSTWDWAEPGVLFIDRINEMNNLWYCEEISATNPCAEQPLPPFGACLLGSFNVVKYVSTDRSFKEAQFRRDIHTIIRAMDNVIDRTVYPLPEQEEEAKNKRRMGIGVTGMAAAGAILGLQYGSDAYLNFQDTMLEILRDESYSASSDLSEEKGSFPLYDADKYLQGKFIKTLPDWVRQKIIQKGIRNSHLLSIAPTGTISLTADNVPSGIEPPFDLEFTRDIQTEDGPRTERMKDYAYEKYGIKTRTSNEVSGADHVRVLSRAQLFVDSAVSKTCNVGDGVTFDEFKKLYEDAYDQGCKGITTFRAAGKRYGILNEIGPTPDEPMGGRGTQEVSGEACFIDPQTGKRSCE